MTLSCCDCFLMMSLCHFLFMICTLILSSVSSADPNPPVPGQDIHEGGLPGSRGPHDGYQVSAGEVPRDPPEQSLVT